MSQKSFVSMIAILLISSTSFGQEIKKKLRGKYSGAVPSYVMQVGEELLNVDGTQITITFLEGNKITESIGSANLEGSYRISSDSKSSTTIQVNYPGQLVYEELVLNKKDKSILRKGFYPQPDSKLVKDI